MKKTDENEGYFLEYNNDESTRDKCFLALLEFFKKHETFTGESIQQCDGPIIDAPNLLSDIADNIFEFDQNYKE